MSGQYVLVRTISAEWAAQVLFGEVDFGTWAEGPYPLHLADTMFSAAVAVGAYGPHTGNKVRVMTQDEWKRVNGERS